MIGLDTIHLTLPTSAARISPDFAARLSEPGQSVSDIKQSITPEKNPFLYRDSNDLLVSGQAAFLNAGDFTLDILPSGDAPNLLLKFSGAAFTGDNTTPLDGERLRAIMPLIESELRDWGLEADWQDAKVSRVDAVLNAEMNHKFPAYVDVWRGSAFRYGVVPNFPNGTSFRLTMGTSPKWKGQWEAYDKGLERDKKAAKGRAKASCRASNLGRFELRLRGEGVARALNVERPKLGDLMRSDAFEKLSVAYRTSASDELLSMFKDTNAALSRDELLSARLASVTEALADGSTPAKFNAALSRLTLLAIYDFHGACEFWEKSFAALSSSDSEAERETKKKAMQRFRRALRDESNFIQSSSQVESGVPRRELVCELREKLLSES